MRNDALVRVLALRDTLDSGRRWTHSRRDRSQRLRAAWLARTQPAVVVAQFAVNHIVSLGQARDEMERKA